MGATGSFLVVKEKIRDALGVKAVMGKFGRQNRAVNKCFSGYVPAYLDVINSIRSCSFH